MQTDMWAQRKKSHPISNSHSGLTFCQVRIRKLGSFSRRRWGTRKRAVDHPLAVVAAAVLAERPVGTAAPRMMTTRLMPSPTHRRTVSPTQSRKKGVVWSQRGSCRATSSFHSCLTFGQPTHRHKRPRRGGLLGGQPSSYCLSVSSSSFKVCREDIKRGKGNLENLFTLLHTILDIRLLIPTSHFHIHVIPPQLLILFPRSFPFFKWMTDVWFIFPSPR